MDWLWWVIPALVIWFLFKKNQKTYWAQRNVPGPKPWPLVGNMLEFFGKSNTERFSDGIKKYGKIYGYMEFNKPALVIGDPELLKDILIKDFHLFSDRTSAISDSLYSKVLPFLMGEDWKRVRKFSSPSFSGAKIKNFVPDMLEAVKTFKFVLTSRIGQEINLRKVSSALTVETIGRCAFGIKSNSQIDAEDEFYKYVHSLSAFKLLRTFVVLTLPDRLRNMLGFDLFPSDAKQYMDSLIRELYQRESRQEGEATSVLGLWVRNMKAVGEGALITTEELIALGTVFIVGGFETTSNLLAMSFHTLAVQPDIQARLFNEISEQYSGEKIARGDFSNFVYLDAFINEVLRKYPPIVYWERDAAEDYLLGSTGITIEKGTKVITPFYAIHNDADFYAEPQLIRPERFSPENKDSIPKYAFLPFGLGPRNCAGMKFGLTEAKLVLTEVVRHFTVVPCGKTVIQPKSVGVFLPIEFEPLYVKFCLREL